ncbi:formyltransferase family protein [Verrucomicrobia bacterium]|nr:formyltransferase family protein [Verrucomicrobiota bacterium]
MNFVFCAYRGWALELYEKLSKKYKNTTLITSPKKLSIKTIKKINPNFIFFPDWSWMVPVEIINEYKCICFHESPLPKFRGGSPLQNQIIRGVKKTKTTAFIMSENIDEGDIVLQKNLSLEGELTDIFSRMAKNDFFMIQQILQGKYTQRKQKGKKSYYKRRLPGQSELKTLNHPKQYLYNFIRMLSDPYPNAFIKIGTKTITFKSAKFEDDELKIQGEIK